MLCAPTLSRRRPCAICAVAPTRPSCLSLGPALTPPSVSATATLHTFQVCQPPARQPSGDARMRHFLLEANAVVRPGPASGGERPRSGPAGVGEHQAEERLGFSLFYHPPNRALRVLVTEQPMRRASIQLEQVCFKKPKGPRPKASIDKVSWPTTERGPFPRKCHLAADDSKIPLLRRFNVITYILDTPRLVSSLGAIAHDTAHRSAKNPRRLSSLYVMLILEPRFHAFMDRPT